MPRAERRTLPEQTFQEKVLSIANRVYSAHDMQEPTTVGHRSDLDVLVHPHSFGEVKAAIQDAVAHPEHLLTGDRVHEGNVDLVVAGLMYDAVESGATVVIDDRTHLSIVGIRQGEGGVWEVVQKARLGKEELTTIQNPRVSATVTPEAVSLGISGRDPDARRRKKNVVVRSDGGNMPKSFVIVAEKDGKRNVLVAKQDVRGTFSALYEHLGPSQWVLSGKDTKDVVARQERRK